ncbi:MAG: pantothenate kinase [Cyanobacteriota bacterium]|nr:pantothenate kinase [Cyanobacteriota bacterium]
MDSINTLDWLSLAIGNSRLHWAWFRGERLVETRDRAHFPSDCPEAILPPHWPELPLYFASVVPQQSARLKAYATQNGFTSSLTEISLSDIPLQGIYSTMGIDRALSVWGAIQTYGLPILVIDAGTALTFTGATSSPHHPITPSPRPLTPSPQLIGGAILPGLRLQFQTLGQQTAALPEVSLPPILPSRWSLDTPSAIASGVIYTVLAGLRDFIREWRDRYPESQIILTGGDADWLCGQLQNDAEMTSCLVVDARLIFWGMRSLVLGKAF